MRDLYIVKNWVVMSFPFPLFWHLSPLSSLSCPSLFRWLPLSIQLISNRLYWHDWGILMVPELYKKRGKKHAVLYLPLRVFLASQPQRVATLSLPACNQCSQHRTQTISYLLTRRPYSTSSVWVFFLCCPPVNAYNWNILFVFPIRDKKDVSMDGLEAMVDISACSFSLASF